ncbi:MAG: hypothetical protein R2724_07135 [Bryobacterales bacterium]
MADVVSRTATTATTPVVEDADIPAGLHINAIGSYQPHVRAGAAVRHGGAVVASWTSAARRGGDFLQAIDGAVSGR